MNTPSQAMKKALCISAVLFIIPLAGLSAQSRDTSLPSEKAAKSSPVGVTSQQKAAKSNPVSEKTDTTRTPEVELELDIVDSSDSTATGNQSEKPWTEASPKEWDDLYLDTVVVKKASAINDYTMIGVQYGVGLSQVMWNPSVSQKMVFMPYNVGIMYTRYGKMFGFMPYFGIQIGLFYTQEGYQFKTNKDSGYTPVLYGTGETSAKMTVLELPVLAHCHIDFWKMKVIVNVGCYAGYRLSIERVGNDVSDEYRTSFRDYNNRFDFGVKGGVGFGFIFDPVEIHFQAMYKHSLSSLYKPDYYSDTYYRYAYPSNIIISAGLHFQITKRTGMTNKMLKQQARDKVFGVENSTIIIEQ